MVDRSGRWRSQYAVNFEDKTVKGFILVNVHYYEQGNVRLLSSSAEYIGTH
jgi:capping protein (actin filament) muscle Z-line, alpha